MDRSTAIILSSLGAVAAIYALSRTERGQAIAADVAGAVVSAITPRGIRNNNPGNIEWIAAPAKRWRGMIAADGRYGIFDTPANGVRAIGGELKASIRKNQTLQQAIYEWAPPTENNTDSYVNAVARATGLQPSMRFGVADLPSITAAIIKHENGQQPYSAADIAAWVNA